MIGIFDSGIGGLTVVRELLRLAPEASFVYLGDTARTPYGNKSPDVIRQYAREDASFLIAQGATSIVIACNTVSANALDEVRTSFSNVPVYDVITPAVEDALALTPHNVAVVGTRATIGSGIYQKLLGVLTVSKEADATPKDVLKITSTACPLFVPLVEEGLLDGAVVDAVIESYLQSSRTQGVDTMILGCTHYPLLKDSIQKFMGPDVRLVDSAQSVVKRLLADKRIVVGEQRYFFTDTAAHTQAIAAKWLGRDILPQKATLS